MCHRYPEATSEMIHAIAEFAGCNATISNAINLHDYTMLSYMLEP